MKKFLAALLICTVLMTCLTGCGTEARKEGLNIVVTVFPAYDWVRTVLGSDNITLLLDNGVDLHSYQPTAADLVNISQCDLFVYIGGESDAWVADALANPVNPNRKVLNLMELLGEDALEEEEVEGMEAEEEEEEEAFDEHIWLSLKNAQALVPQIAAALCDLDPDRADAYTQNSNAYVQKLSALDDQYQKAVEEKRFDTLLFGDRFPFRYLVEDYDLDYYAAFSGCSAESEASFETVSFLANKLKELGLPAVMVLEGSDQKLAQTILDTAGVTADIVSVDSMQSVEAQDATYLSIMEKNLTAFQAALG